MILVTLERVLTAIHISHQTISDLSLKVVHLLTEQKIDEAISLSQKIIRIENALEQLESANADVLRERYEDLSEVLESE